MTEESMQAAVEEAKAQPNYTTAGEVRVSIDSHIHDQSVLSAAF